MLVDILAWIVELILDMRQITALATHLVGIALGPDGEDDAARLDRFATGEGKRKIAFFSGDRLHVGVEPHIDLAARRLLVPDAQHLLALAGLERSEEHTSELQSLMRISHAVFCLHTTQN